MWSPVRTQALAGDSESGQSYASREGHPASHDRGVSLRFFRERIAAGPDGPHLFDPPYGRGQELDTRLLEARSGRLVVNASNAESAQVLSAAGLESIEDRG